MSMHYIGIDIGSTATKTVIMDENKKNILYKNRIPSGWNSKETGEAVLDWIKETLQNKDFKITATGYGRVSVPFADKTLTEISCHGKGAHFLAKKDVTVIDIGGQDTKVIVVKDGLELTGNKRVRSEGKGLKPFFRLYRLCRI